MKRIHEIKARATSVSATLSFLRSITQQEMEKSNL